MMSYINKLLTYKDETYGDTLDGLFNQSSEFSKIIKFQYLACVLFLTFSVFLDITNLILFCIFPATEAWCRHITSLAYIAGMTFIMIIKWKISASEYCRINNAMIYRVEYLVSLIFFIQVNGEMSWWEFHPYTNFLETK